MYVCRYIYVCIYPHTYLIPFQLSKRKEKLKKKKIPKRQFWSILDILHKEII